jgi:hypothetical protein
LIEGELSGSFVSNGVLFLFFLGVLARRWRGLLYGSFFHFS